MIGVVHVSDLANHEIHRGVRLRTTYILTEKVNPLDEHFMVVRFLSVYKELYLVNITIWELEG